jgi:hypothetical protein
MFFSIKKLGTYDDYFEYAFGNGDKEEDRTGIFRVYPEKKQLEHIKEAKGMSENAFFAMWFDIIVDVLLDENYPDYRAIATG